MKEFIKEFKTFALRGNAIDLAIGVVIGAAFNNIVTSLVNNVLTPPLSLLTGGINFSDLAILLPGTDAAIQYGLFVQALISFVITAFALFLLVRALNRLKLFSTPSNEPTKSAELIVLEEIRDSLKK